MVTRNLILKQLRRLHWFASRDPVEDELRGWNWDKPPLRPSERTKTSRTTREKLRVGIGEEYAW